MFKSSAAAICVTASLLWMSACAPAGTNIYQDTAVGGLGAAAVGAATGTAIGAIIKNGDVAKSALLGTAIAIPIGMVAGAVYSTYSENAQISDNNELIQKNHAELVSREHELEEMRRSIKDDSDILLVPDDIEHQYNGPTLGNRYR
ncbi:MAG: hypothetical protein K1X79_08840 [Oligoflexia bacterium]|nr:hypothetical protein [Oligoflexia bacterium]